MQLGWKVGDGKRIRLGVDPIAGLNSSFMLSEGLRDYLCDYDISTLNLPYNLGDGANLQSYYLSATDLDLGGSWKDQWTDYVKGLTHGCIKLKEVKDTLLWMFNKVTGVVSSSSAYDHIISSLIPLSPVSSHSHIWCCNVPLKMKCFTWLSWKTASILGII